MAIPKQIRTRATRAIVAFIAADADFGPLTNSGASIYRQPFEDMGTLVKMSPNPRQLHIYPGASVKSPGTTALWTRDFEIVIEYYSPRNEAAPDSDDATVDDEIDELANRLYGGQSTSPGRFLDPDGDGASEFITTEIRQIRVGMPSVAAGEAAIRRDISIIFGTTETAAGKRPYDLP